MADKPKAPAAPTPPSIEAKILGFVGLVVLILLIVAPAILSAFNVDTTSFFDASSVKEGVISVVSKLFTTVTFVSVFLTLIFVVAMMYVKARTDSILEKWTESESLLNMGQGAGPGGTSPKGGAAELAFPNNLPGAGQDMMLGGNLAGVHGPEAEAGNEKWLDIEAKINSMNPSDWRLAILEADILLDNMLIQMGLPGETLGERLKSADASFFSTISEAWTAHKIRNIIAHEGSSYDLTYNEARKAIDLFRRVFEEFYFI